MNLIIAFHKLTLKISILFQVDNDTSLGEFKSIEIFGITITQTEVAYKPALLITFFKSKGSYIGQ